MPEITDTTYQGSIAAAVRAEFSRLGFKQKDLASVIERSRPTAADKWYGRTSYTTKELETVSRFLGISPYDLNESAALGVRFADGAPVDEVARITPPQDAWAQPSRSRSRRAS